MGSSGQSVNPSVLQKDLNTGTEKAGYLAVYRHTFSYADDHGELNEYRASRKLDKECSQAVVDAIRQNYDGKHLNKESVKPVVEEYGHHSGQELWKVISHRWRNTLQACVK